MHHTPRITLNPHKHRFEARVKDELAGHLTYRMDDDTMVLVSTQVDPKFEGKGVGSSLVRFAFESAQESGDTKVKPLCPFTVTWAQRHPEYSGLLAE